MKKRVVEMWLIHDVLFTKKKSAVAVEDGKDTAKRVYVGVDVNLTDLEDGESSNYYGSWIFDKKAEADSEVKEYNDN